MPYFARPPSASVDGPWNTPSIGTAPQLSMGSGNLMINNLQPVCTTNCPLIEQNLCMHGERAVSLVRII